VEYKVESCKSKTSFSTTGTAQGYIYLEFKTKKGTKVRKLKLENVLKEKSQRQVKLKFQSDVTRWSETGHKSKCRK
jgi:hypothetical protein